MKLSAWNASCTFYIWKLKKNVSFSWGEIMDCCWRFSKNRSIERGIRYDAMWCDAMRWQGDWMDLRGTAHTVVEKRSEIIDAIATEPSPFDGATDKGSINDSLPSRPASPIPHSDPPPPPSYFFFTKDNPRWPPFCLLSEIAWPLLGNWPKIAADRRLLCGHGLNFAPPQKYHWLLFPHLLLLYLLLPDASPSYSVSSNLGTRFHVRSTVAPWETLAR